MSPKSSGGRRGGAVGTTGGAQRGFRFGSSSSTAPARSRRSGGGGSTSAPTEECGPMDFMNSFYSSMGPAGSSSSASTGLHNFCGKFENSAMEALRERLKAEAEQFFASRAENETPRRSRVKSSNAHQKKDEEAMKGRAKLAAHQARAMEIAFGCAENTLSAGSRTPRANGSRSQHFTAVSSIPSVIAEDEAGEGEESRDESTTPARQSLLPQQVLANTPSSSSQVVVGGSSSQLEQLTVSSVEFSLCCPFTRRVMEIPVRSQLCRHLQCCDLQSWVALFEKSRSLRDPQVHCVVCKQRVAASSLEVDFWMFDVLRYQVPTGTHLVVLMPSGELVSGDLERRRKREREVEEIILDTQPSQYVVMASPSRGASSESGVASAPSMSFPRTTTVKIEPGLREDDEEDRGCNDEETHETAATPEEDTCHSGSSRQLWHPREAGALLTGTPPHYQEPRESDDRAGAAQVYPPTQPSWLWNGEGGQEGSSAPGATAVSVVAVESSRVLPSQARRLWTPYCPQCSHRLRRPTDSGSQECGAEQGGCGALHSSRPSAGPPVCERCGWRGADWDACSLARFFVPTAAPPPSSVSPADSGTLDSFLHSSPGAEDGGTAGGVPVSIELLPDDTLLLRGVDAVAEHLHRGGFHRSVFLCGGDGDGEALPPPLQETFQSPQQSQKFQEGLCQAFRYNGVWSSTTAFTRLELDFMVACCERVAQGEDIRVFRVDGPQRQMVPPAFRLPLSKLRRGEGEGVPPAMLHSHPLHTPFGSLQSGGRRPPHSYPPPQHSFGASAAGLNGSQVGSPSSIRRPASTTAEMIETFFTPRSGAVAPHSSYAVK